MSSSLEEDKSLGSHYDISLVSAEIAEIQHQQEQQEAAAAQEAQEAQEAAQEAAEAAEAAEADAAASASSIANKNTNSGGVHERSDDGDTGGSGGSGLVSKQMRKKKQPLVDSDGIKKCSRCRVKRTNESEELLSKYATCTNCREKRRIDNKKHGNLNSYALPSPEATANAINAAINASKNNNNNNNNNDTSDVDPNIMGHGGHNSSTVPVEGSSSNLGPGAPPTISATQTSTSTVNATATATANATAGSGSGTVGDEDYDLNKKRGRKPKLDPHHHTHMVSSLGMSDENGVAIAAATAASYKRRKLKDIEHLPNLFTNYDDFLERIRYNTENDIYDHHFRGLSDPNIFPRYKLEDVNADVFHVTSRKIIQSYIQPMMDLTGYRFPVRDYHKGGTKSKKITFMFICSQDKSKQRKSRSNDQRKITNRLKTVDCDSKITLNYDLVTGDLKINFQHRSHTPYIWKMNSTALHQNDADDGSLPLGSTSSVHHHQHHLQHQHQGGPRGTASSSAVTAAANAALAHIDLSAINYLHEHQIEQQVQDAANHFLQQAAEAEKEQQQREGRHEVGDEDNAHDDNINSSRGGDRSSGNNNDDNNNNNNNNNNEQDEDDVQQNIDEQLLNM